MSGACAGIAQLNCVAIVEEQPQDHSLPGILFGENLFERAASRLTSSRPTGYRPARTGFIWAQKKLIDLQPSTDFTCSSILLATSLSECRLY